MILFFLKKKKLNVSDFKYNHFILFGKLIGVLDNRSSYSSINLIFQRNLATCQVPKPKDNIGKRARKIECNLVSLFFASLLAEPVEKGLNEDFNVDLKLLMMFALYGFFIKECKSEKR